ncbi:MAG TPA: hypothetical protein VK404_09540, partial [Spirosoma sp.]|nr:hypothetical protein [Spirosoma sp.]
MFDPDPVDEDERRDVLVFIRRLLLPVDPPLALSVVLSIVPDVVLVLLLLSIVPVEPEPVVEPMVPIEP